jgi:hypothetical protein
MSINPLDGLLANLILYSLFIGYHVDAIIKGRPEIKMISDRIMQFV